MSAMTSAWASIAARALLALCAWGCASPLTEIVLAVDAQDADITQVRILVTSPSGATSLDESQAVTAASFPLTLSLTRSGAPYEPLVIEVRAERPSGRITRRVRTGFVEGERRLLRVALSSACTGMAFDATTTCITASCVSDVVPAASLPPFTGSVPGSDAGTGDPRDAGPVDAWMPDAGPPSPCSPLCAADRTCFAGLCLDTDAPLAPGRWRRDVGSGRMAPEPFGDPTVGEEHSSTAAATTPRSSSAQPVVSRRRSSSACPV